MLYCRNLADHPSAHSDRSTPRHRANVPTPRNTWVQLRATSLVEPTCQSCEFPPTRHIHPGSTQPVKTSRWLLLIFSTSIADLESNIVCNYSSLTSALCAQQGGATSVCKNKREKSARVTLCILTCFCKSCFFIFFYLIWIFFFSNFFGMMFLH